MEISGLNRQSLSIILLTNVKMTTIMFYNLREKSDTTRQPSYRSWLELKSQIYNRLHNKKVLISLHRRAMDLSLFVFFAYTKGIFSRDVTHLMHRFGKFSRDNTHVCLFKSVNLGCMYMGQYF